MLVEGDANGRAKTSLAVRSVANAGGDGAELLEHLARNEFRCVLDTQALEGSLGEIPQHLPGFGVEIVE